MSAANTDAPARLGLLGDWFDPVSQLLEETYPDGRVEFIHVTDPSVDADHLDEIFVLSQSDALSHFAALSALDLPCRILLRREEIGSTSRWLTGLQWLGASLQLADRPNIQLVALNPDAAQALSEVIALPVAPMPQLPEITKDRPEVLVSSTKGVITFSGQLIDGEDEERLTEIDLFNWARLRRLAVLKPADPADEYIADLVEYARGRGAAAPVPAQARRQDPCIISVVPNGVGLGHVTRMMAISKGLQEISNTRVIFWSFSRAAEILQSAGFEVILRQNIMHLDAHPPDWRQWETLEFASAIRHFAPSAVSYDGGVFDKFMIDALRSPGCGRCGSIWVRRGMLHPDSDAQLLEAERYCDVVLEPGDLAVDMDQGPTRTRRALMRGFSSFVETPPVTLKPFLPPYERRTARKKLGLGRGRYCLVSLGGAFGNWDTIRNQIVEFAKQYRVKLIWAQSPLAGAANEDLGDAGIRQFYPLSRYLSAFDGMISATGYNSYHELMLGFDGPVLLAPTNFGRLDDQVSRATYAGNQGWASVVYADQPEDQSHVIADFLLKVRRGEKTTGRPAPVQGAIDMAEEILKVCRKYQ